MNTPKRLLFAAALISIAALAIALYLQHVKHLAPCPWCVIQRFAFTGIVLVGLIFAFLPAASARIGTGLGTLIALVGAGSAGWHLWIRAHPEVTCGLDPVETALNDLPTATLLPFLYKADGICTDALPPFLGLSIPLWSFLWFVAFSLVLGWAVFAKPGRKR